MSKSRTSSERSRLLEDLALAGRRQSDATVMYHSTLAERLQIGPSEWKTLSLLEQGGPLTAGELSQRSGLAPASITGILDRLEDGGWINRTRDPADRRRVIVDLDPRATGERYAFLFEGLRRRLSALYEQYDTEQLALIQEVLSQLAEAQLEATKELQENPLQGR